MQCGINITPTMECLNPDPDFTLGGWEAGNGASINPRDATLPPGGYVQQYAPVCSSDCTYQESLTSVAVGKSYEMRVSASAPGSGDFTAQVGASTPGQVLAVQGSLDASNPSGVFSGTFTVESSMLVGGENLPIRVLAGEYGGEVHIHYVCVRGSTDPVTTTQCLGTWMLADGGDALGNLVSAGSYVVNKISLDGGYYLDMSGSAEYGTTTIAGRYAGNSAQDQLFSLSIPGAAFSETASFFGSYTGGDLRVYASKDVIYSRLCLRKGGGTAPKPLPFPECGKVTSQNSLGVWMLPPYTTTNAYDGQVQPAYYIGEMAYNYAIYPLVCTTVHIANIQAKRFDQFQRYLFIEFTLIGGELAAIINLLQQILDKIGDQPNTCGLLDVMIWLFKLVFELLAKLLEMIFELIKLILTVMRGIVVDAQSEDAIVSPISCAGNEEWMCAVLALVNYTDSNIGSLGGAKLTNIIAWMAVGMLTVRLAFWVKGQVQAMNQPAAEPRDAD
jgi:hypothetical protein